MVRFLIIPSIISRVASVTVIHPVLQYQFSQIPNEQLLTEEDQAELMVRRYMLNTQADPPC